MVYIRKYYLFTFLAIVLFQSPGYAQVDWMETMGVADGIQQNDCYIRDLKTDKDNNIYVIGNTYFGADNILFYKNQKKMNLAYESFNTPLFLAKFDASGNLLWTKDLVNNNDGKLAIDNNGNIYISAGFYKAASIGGDSIHTYKNGVYLAKFNKSGIFQWVKTGNCPDYPQIFSMICDADGKVYISGNYTGFSMQWDTTQISSNVSPAIYTMRYDEKGNIDWVNNIDYIDNGWTVQGNAIKMKIGTDGNLYALFAEGGRSWISSCEFNKWHMILACLTKGGNINWTKDYVCSDLMTASDMDINIFGEIVVVGSFRGTFTFGNANITSAFDDNAGCHTTEAFITKFDRLGNVLSAENVPASGYSSDYYNVNFNNDASYVISGMRYYKNSKGYAGYPDNFPNGKNRFFISKYDFIGNPQGEVEFYKTTSNSWPDAYFETDPMVQIDSEGNYIIADNYKGQYDTLPNCIYNQNQNLILYKLNRDKLKLNTPQNNNNTLFLSPNPARDIIYLEIQDNAYLQYNASITDMTGKLVLQNKKTDLTKAVFQIDISSLAAGMYLLNAQNETGIKSAKFVKYSR